MSLRRPSIPTADSIFWNSYRVSARQPVRVCSSSVTTPDWRGLSIAPSPWAISTWPDPWRDGTPASRRSKSLEPKDHGASHHLGDRDQRDVASRCGEAQNGGPGGVCEHDLGCRLDRRRPQRAHQLTAVFGVQNWGCDGQCHLAVLPED